MHTEFASAFKEFLIKISENSYLRYSGILAAASPGRDSVALCHLLKETNSLKGIVHCNFGLHPTDNDDEAFVRQLAERLEVPFYCKRFNARRYAQTWGITQQVAVRRLRYAYFDEMRRKMQIKYVASAFHADEALELLFIQIARGSNPLEMTSLWSRQGWMIRPLMFATREEIAAYASEKGLAYLEDHYEFHEDGLHEKVRREVFPAMESLNPHFHKTTRQTLQRWLGFIEEYRGSHNYNRLFWDGREQKIIYSLHSHKGGLEEIEKMYHAIKDYGFTYEQAEKISVTMLTRDRFDQSTYVYLSETHRVEVTHSWYNLYIFEAVELELHTVDDGPIQFTNGILLLEKHDKVPENRYSTTNTIYLDASKLTWPLRFSRWKPDAQFHAASSYHRPQSLHDYFKNRNIDGRSRENYWIIWSDQDICCIADREADMRYAASPSCTDVLGITFYPKVIAEREY